jgi:hypothetical protein
MQLTEALTSKAVRREITPGEELDRDYSIRTPEVKNYTLSISDENAVPPVDRWAPNSEDIIFRGLRGKQIMAPLAKILTNDDEDMLMFDSFILSVKKCYSSEEKVDHFTQYLNYFEKYYDPDHELLAIYARMKFMIDTDDAGLYTKQQFMADIKRDILFSTFARKVKAMNEDNFIIHIKRNKKDGNVLQYSNRHLSALMEIGLFQIILIPLLTHYAYMKKIQNIDAYLMEFYEILIIDMHPDIDILTKLSETANSRIIQDMSKNSGSWDKQYIRSKNKFTYNIEIVWAIISQIIPKAIYEMNILNLIYVSIKGNITNKIIRAKYEYSFNQLSSDRNEGDDDDDNSEFDKFESHLSKKNEALLMHNQVNFHSTMKQIEERFGPFSKEEIEYYKVELSKGRKSPIVPHQKILVCYLFYKWFGDPSALGSIDLTSYIKLIIAAKRILAANNLHTMEAILSGKFVKVIKRVNMNKKELQKITSSSTYEAVAAIYHNEKITNLLIAMLATIVSSKFQIIDFENKENTGLPFVPQQELLNEEFLIYASLINNR